MCFYWVFLFKCFVVCGFVVENGFCNVDVFVDVFCDNLFLIDVD